VSSAPKKKRKAMTTVERSVSSFLKILEADGVLTEEQVVDAHRRSPIVMEELRRNERRVGYRGAGENLDPAQVIAHMQFRDKDNETVSEDRIAEVFAKHAGYRYAKLDPLKLNSKLVTETLTLPFARRHTVLPIAVDSKKIIVTTNNPYEMGTLDQIRSVTKKEVEVWISARSDILRILRDLFGFRTSVAQAANEFDGGTDLGNLEAFVSLKSGEDIEASDTHVVNAVEYLLRYAIEQRASDIHIEPHREETAVRMRIDGVLHSIYRMPKAVHPPVLSRIKSMARMDIAEKRRPQDGRIKTNYEGREVELRISTLPVAFGEKVVIRLLDPQVLMRDLTDLGLFQRQMEELRTFIYRPHGLILVTGPTGSGKTTTLYSALSDLATPEVNVTTIEDPIEMVIDNFNQVSVNNLLGVSFAYALRTILRQDPDIIMVGEIRDAETARMAVQASLTGHLVLSTVHTNDSASAITRLLELGIPAYLLSSTLVGVIAQRLVRRNCVRCKTDSLLSETQCRELGIPLSGGEAPKLTIYRGKGCPHCRETGYRGRSGVYEMLHINPSVREKIVEGVELQDIRRCAVEEGMMNLRESAIKKMAQGVTTYDEVLRVTASVDL
jgi:general secretion pathway protein E